MSLRSDAGIALGALVAASYAMATPASVAATAASAASVPSSSMRSARARPPLRGADFPDGVVALTWDDGPDVHSLELAQYLRSRHVAGTFFVVGAWDEGVSEEPGYGRTKLETGYGYLPILGDLIALGHRVGNHTRNHVLLGHATTALIEDQLEPLPTMPRRVRMFRAPGGFWTDESAAAFAGAAFDDLVGPIHWDIDAKDWECSLYCRSDAPAKECEPGPMPNEPRVKATVVADRYLAQIESRKHGIVLMHDRVGDVGSPYALTIAERLVPALIERDYVFAAPVLRFGALERVEAREANPPGVEVRRSRPREAREANPPGVEVRRSRPRDVPPSGHTATGDLNGDGREDTCRATADGIACALMGRAGPKAETLWSSVRTTTFTLADVNADGRADLCIDDRCALAP